MRTYILKRLLLLPVTLIGISFVTFVILQFAPGDPAAMKVSPGVGGQQGADRSVSEEVYEKTRAQFDLDKPKVMQYVRWLGRLCGIKVEVQGAKHLYDDEVEELLVTRYRDGNAEAIAGQRETIAARVEEDFDLAAGNPEFEAEVDRQLEDWVGGQAEERRFKHTEAINAIRQDYVGRYGEEFEAEFWYTGLSLNRTESGYWYPLDFGQAITDNREVWSWLWEKLPRSLELSLLSIFIAYVVAIPLGIHSAVFKGSFVDATVTTLLFVLYSLPSFWVGIMLLLLVSDGGLGVHWFPVKGLGLSDVPPGTSWLEAAWIHVQHLVLPVTCLTYASFAYISRQMRAGMLEVIRQDYIRTARAKGLSEKVVIFKHALRNSLIPILTIVAVVLPTLIGGSIIIETIFNIDGIGKLSFDAILTRDYPILMAIFTLSAFLTLVGILTSDILYAVVNPQISFEGN